MKVAVISDPHGDLVALRVVMADLEARRPDHVLVAGDLVQGGPQPAEVLDELESKGWPIARGNSDDLLVNLANGRPLGFKATPELLARGHWTIARLGTNRLARLEALPAEIRRPWAPNGSLVVVHATPWSTEEVVLADASDQMARRMVTEASAAVLAYGHIHSPYHRRVDDSVLLSVGAISGSNDVDGRPAYTMLTMDQTFVTVEVIRVECPLGPQLDAYLQAGLEATQRDRDRLEGAGTWPLRAPDGKVIQVWP